MKSRIIGKKQLLVFTLSFAFVLAVFVNWYYTNQFNESTMPETTDNYNLGEAQFVNSNSVSNNSDDFFSTAKIKKKKAHDEAIKHLENIISDKNIDNDTIQIARNELVNFSNLIKTETDIENVIDAQLDFNSIVMLNSEGVEIIVPNDTLNDDNINKLKNIVLSKTKFTSDNIVIIEEK